MDMDRKKVLFIVNPASASQKTQERWEQSLPLIEKANFDYEVKFTKASGCAIKFATDASLQQQFATIISVGGDGTANEVINGMLNSQLPRNKLPNFTIFPSGTGSDSVRTLGIPKDLDGFLRLVETNVSKPIDVGIATYLTLGETEKARFFLNACDVGLGATVAHTVNSMNQDSEKKSGKAKYFRSIMEQVFKFKPFSANYEASDECVEIDKTVIIAICNGMFFGGGVKISPVSKMNDGQLELFATVDVSKLRLLELVSKVYSGSHVGHSKVQFSRDSHFKIQLKKPQLLETDGEVCGVVSAVDFKVLPHAIEVLH